MKDWSILFLHNSCCCVLASRVSPKYLVVKKPSWWLSLEDSKKWNGRGKKARGFFLLFLPFFIPLLAFRLFRTIALQTMSSFLSWEATLLVSLMMDHLLRNVINLPKNWCCLPKVLFNQLLRKLSFSLADQIPNSTLRYLISLQWPLMASNSLNDPQYSWFYLS